MRRLVWGLWVVTACIQPATAETRRLLEYSPAPVDNPLKGLVPYQGDRQNVFPHSMEFGYLAYASLVKGDDEFDWQPLESMLQDISSRGHQTIFRIYLEFPGKADGIPEFLVRDGLKITSWNHQGNPAETVETPDYENDRLRKSMRHFIAALGAKYDGDPRIGFITAGLLGLWGEWHTHPNDDWFASKSVQREVMDAYEAAFKITPVLLRYPVGDRSDRLETNANRRFGYHDDSFAWATLDTGKPEDQWFYQSSLRLAGPAAEAKWKTQPIGGEIRPEAWGHVFDEKPADPRIQNFRQCVEVTHVSWLMDSGMFQQKPQAERIARAKRDVQRMGYEFHVPTVTISQEEAGPLMLKLEVENRGVAPFYHDWQPEYGLLEDGKVIQTFAGSGKLTNLLPEQKPRVWTDALDLNGLDPGTYTLGIRVPNKMNGGKPLRFANATQNTEWLVLGELPVP